MTKARSELHIQKLRFQTLLGQMRMSKAFNWDIYRMFQVSNLEDAAPVTDTLAY